MNAGLDIGDGTGDFRTMESEDKGIEVRTYFVRGRNALVARAEFSELFAAMYLHRLDTGVPLNETEDQLMRDALASATLHAASRPRNEMMAWTVNFQNPLLNVFASGDNRLGTVVGNVLTGNVKEGGENLFYADVVDGTNPQRRSVVEFEGDDFLRAVEEFYQQSEQRMVRLFYVGEEDLVLISAQPDCDLEWLDGLNEEKIGTLDKDNELSLLEQRYYRFECGCNQRKMLAVLAPVMARDPEGLFEGEETIRIHCPRCGARHTVTREALEAYLSEQKAEKA